MYVNKKRSATENGIEIRGVLNSSTSSFFLLSLLPGFFNILICLQRSPGWRKNPEQSLLCSQSFCRPASTCSPSASLGGTSALTTAFTSATSTQVSRETNLSCFYFINGYMTRPSRFFYMIYLQARIFTQNQTTTGSC